MIFLLVGYILRMLDPGQTLARTLLTTGWVFGAITAAAILVAAVGLLLTALRNSTPADTRAQNAAQGRAGQGPRGVAGRPAGARHPALPPGGTLADPGSAAVRHPAPPAPTGRIPRLGYDRPGFTSPDDGTASGRPSFTSPDYTSPDFGGPEHRPE